MRQDMKESRLGDSSPGGGVQVSKTHFVDQLTNFSRWFGFLGLVFVLIILVNSTNIIQAKSLNLIFQDNADVIIADDFDRPDNDAIENGWIELEAGEAQVGIQGERLCFLDFRTPFTISVCLPPCSV